MNELFQSWGQKGSVHSPPSAKSKFCQRPVYAEMFSKKSDTPRHSFNRENSVISSVSMLLGHCGPLAIFWFVISVGVFTIYRVVIGSKSHIFEKGRKILPSSTHRNTSPSVIFISWVLWVFASLMHGIPASVGRGNVSYERVTVSDFRHSIAYSNVVFNYRCWLQPAPDLI